MNNNIIPLTLISILADGKFHSNKELREKLGMSCEKINKHIQIIQKLGIDVLTIINHGYSLLEPIQLLNEKIIQKKIKRGCIVVLPIIDSTNQYLLDRIDSLHSGDSCLTEYQYMGRGRYGRKWFSPFGSNLYFSIYWYLQQNSRSILGLSVVIGIVIAEVLHDLGADQVRVKWPNDLYLFDRKLAGILVEIRNKSNNKAQIIIGVGINLAMRSVQEKKINQNWINLQEIGISVDRNILAIRLIEELQVSLELFEQYGFAPFLSKWEKVNNLTNCPVKLIFGDKVIYGISRGINQYGALLLEQEGIITQWVVGEVSLRKR